MTWATPALARTAVVRRPSGVGQEPVDVGNDEARRSQHVLGGGRVWQTLPHVVEDVVE